MKIALEAKKLNKAIVQDNYQMPKREHLIELVAQHLPKLEEEA